MIDDDTYLDLSFAERAAKYSEMFPVYGAYQEIIKERNARPVDLPITEPCEVPGSVDTLQGAQLALQRIGHPGWNDKLTVQPTESYTRGLEREVCELIKDEHEPTLESVVLGHFYQFAACIPSVESWLDEPLDEQLDDVEELVQRMTPELLREAVRLAMPKILADMIEQDRARIRRHTFGVVSNEDGAE
jgi:hypothetical protein